MSKTRVAVIFGGMSSEYEVSLKSAASVIRNMPKDKIEVVCVGITEAGRWLYFPGDVDEIEKGTWQSHPDCVAAIISPDRSHKGILKLLNDDVCTLLKIDCVFPVLHGKNGEDGTIQGLLTLSGIPYVGCDTLSSATCMDKAITHIRLENAGIKTAPFATVMRPEIAKLEQKVDVMIKELGLPLFVKPANAGSSVGITKATSREELVDGIKLAFSHDRKVVIEKAIVGKEVEVAVLGNDYPEGSIVGEITPESGWYDYEAKYIANTSKLTIPARLDPSVAAAVQSIAVEAYIAMGCSGLSRVDFFVSDDDEIILNEINTLPGFTSISMYPKLWDKMGVSYSELLERLVEFAIERDEYI